MLSSSTVSHRGCFHWVIGNVSDLEKLRDLVNIHDYLVLLICFLFFEIEIYSFIFSDVKKISHLNL